MKYPAKLAIFLIGMIVFLLGPAPVRAQGDTANISLAADAGFDSFYKDAHWVPVKVTVANSGSAIDGQLRLVTGSSAANTRVTYLAPVALPTQSSKQITLFVHLSSFTNRLKIDLLDERGDVIRTVDTDPLERLDTDDLLYVVVSNDPGELTYLENVTGSRSQAAVAFTTLDGLPAIAAAWNAIDVLVFNDIDTGRLSPVQNEALTSWIGTGGQLVVTGGAGWQQTVNGVADLLPVTVSGNESVTALPLLEGLADEPFRGAGPYLLTVSQLTEGDVVLEQGGVPILARRAIGRGSIYFLALDPNAPPLLNWDGAELLWGRIAEQSQPLPFYAAGIKDSYAAQEAISTLPSLSLPSVWGVLCFLSFYIFAIGPVNYLILKRRGRRELAWLTIPSLILFFSAATYVVGFRVRGNDAIVNQMSIAYGQIGGEQMRVQGVVGLYSPKRTTYDMTVPENNLLRPFQAEFGGIGAGGALAGIEQNGTVTALDVRVDISGIETFLIDTYSPTPDISGQAILRLEGSRFLLDVDVQNNSDLDVAHAALLFGNRVESVGALAPGARFQDSFSLTSRSLSPSGGPATFGPTGPGSSVLSYQTGLLVGSSTPYDDPITLSRSNLLRSLEYGYGSTTPMNIPAGVATLILWTNAPQFDIEVSGLEQSNEATTLYFLELPFSEITENGTEITLDDTLQTWRLLDSSGIYNPTPTGIELTNGWAEFEFIPWPTFQAMQVDKLTLNMEQGSFGGSTAAPQIDIWEWDSGSWASLSGVVWGVNNIPLERSFVGPQNAVRLRVSNSGFQMISIESFYPILTGTLGE